MKRCKIIGCEKVYYAKEFCQSHFDKERRHGDPLFEKENRNLLKCSVEGCIRKQVAKELCNTHYRKVARTGTLVYEKLHDGKAQERNRARTAKWKRDNRITY